MDKGRKKSVLGGAWVKSMCCEWCTVRRFGREEGRTVCGVDSAGQGSLSVSGVSVGDYCCGS